MEDDDIVDPAGVDCVGTVDSDVVGTTTADGESAAMASNRNRVCGPAGVDCVGTVDGDMVGSTADRELGAVAGDGNCHGYALDGQPAVVASDRLGRVHLADRQAAAWDDGGTGRPTTADGALCAIAPTPVRGEQWYGDCEEDHRQGDNSSNDTYPR